MHSLGEAKTLYRMLFLLSYLKLSLYSFEQKMIINSFVVHILTFSFIHAKHFQDLLLSDAKISFTALVASARCANIVLRVSIIQIYKMIVHPRHNSRRSFHGSSMLYLPQIVQKVEMGLIQVVLSLKDMRMESFKHHPFVHITHPLINNLWASAIILLGLAMIIVDLMGLMAILNIQLNVVSIVNLVMSVGIAVEFYVHITHAFLATSGDRNQRMKEALTTMGVSVFSGITFTKLVGVIVLRFSKSEVFVVYYFKMYLSLVLLGFLHGLSFYYRYY